MKKIYIYLGVGLVFLITLLVVINLLGKSKNQNSKTTPSILSPTPYTLLPTTNSNIQNIQPFENTDFSLAYSSSLKQVVVQEKPVVVP